MRFKRAEQVGFAGAMCLDHFNPWSARQGQSGFPWSWSGAALATTNLPFGAVTAPGQGYHPAITAQAISTLAGMFPPRRAPAQAPTAPADRARTGRKDCSHALILNCSLKPSPQDSSTERIATEAASALVDRGEKGEGPDRRSRRCQRGRADEDASEDVATLARCPCP